MSQPNSMVNALVASLLRSPLHGLMSRGLLLISYRGRKSGKEYTLPVQYVRQDREVSIVVGEAQNKTWWRNLRGGGPVRLVIAGRRLSGQAGVWEGPQDSEAMLPALNRYLQAFPPAARMHHVRREADGNFNLEDLRQEAQTTVMVRVTLA